MKNKGKIPFDFHYKGVETVRHSMLMVNF